MFATIRRCIHILSIIAYYQLDNFLPSKKLNWLLYLFKCENLQQKSSESVYERIREAFEDLGPIFVKFGQTLSTRPDLLHPELAKELSKLQDTVKPFDSKEAISIIERSLNSKTSDLFKNFNKEVLASASIAQVHTATLNSGQEVVVKVIRPGIEEIIHRDLSAMRFFARFIDIIAANLKHLRLPELVEEFANTINDELDLRQEAANASKLRANFPDSKIIYVPEVIWNLTSKNVMVIERIFATPIGDLAALEANDVDMKKLAERGVEIFFTQVFKHKYFHADMHPGNIFVDITDPKDPTYKAVDFGIMGSLSKEDQYYLAENFLAFFNRDYYRVAKLHIDSGWVPHYVKVHELEAAVRKVAEPIFGKPLDEISFGEFLITLIQVAKRFEMIVQPQLLLLQKTILNVEGLGRVLYPKLDLWATAKPILEEWMKENYSPKAFISEIRRSAKDYRDVMPKIPQLIDKHLSKQQSPKPYYNPTFWGVLLVGTFYIAVMPNLWQAELIRPFAFALVIFIALRLLRNHKKMNKPF